MGHGTEKHHQRSLPAGRQLSSRMTLKGRLAEHQLIYGLQPPLNRRNRIRSPELDAQLGTVWIESDLLADLKNLARECRVSKSWVVREAIRDYLQRTVVGPTTRCGR